MKQLSKIEIIIGGLLVLAVYALVGSNDHHDGLAAEAHAKHVQQLAQREAAERKAEFNFLAERAAEKTGFVAVMKCSARECTQPCFMGCQS
jgi:hypothetical protein